MIPIVIGNLNKPKLTQGCVQSLNQYTKNVRIVQVDNGCEEPEQFTPYYLSYGNKALGFTRAYNEGIRFARKNFKDWKYIILMNNDVKVKKGWLKPLIDAMESEARVAMVAPLWQDPLNKYTGIPAHSDLIGGHIFSVAQFPDEKTGTKRALSLNFTCVMIDREFIDDCGLMDESMVTFCSDLDYSLRATQNGWRCLVARESMVWHELNQTVNELPNKEQIKQKDQVTFLNKWSGLFLNAVMNEIPLDNARKAYGRVTFLIADEDGTIINWGTGEKTKQGDKLIQTEGVREQFEQLKRLGIEN